MWENINRRPSGDVTSDSYIQNQPWSAAAVSNLVMKANNANSKEDIEGLGFKPTSSHSGYIGDAFKTNADPNYQYNMYMPSNLEGANYGVGDIMFRGRAGTKKWKYSDFEEAKGSYASHCDVIIEKGNDEKGDFIVVAGGNRTNRDLSKSDRNS